MKVSRTYRIEQETADRIAEISEAEKKTATEVIESAIRTYSTEKYVENTARQTDSTDSQALSALIGQLAKKDEPLAKAQEGLEGIAMKWNVSVLRRSGECERTEVADFELSEFFNRIASAEGKAWVLSVERVGDVGDSALVEPDGDELVSQLGKRRWRVMGDPEDGWWVEVDSDGSELPGDWEYDRKGGYVYCSFS